jgi:hypothetical protein
MNSVRYGISGRESPNDANVPRKVAIIVEKNAIITELRIAPCQFKLVKNSSYHFNEYPAGSKASISLVKVKNGTALKESGVITSSGKIKKNSTEPQIIQNV